MKFALLVFAVLMAGGCASGPPFSPVVGNAVFQSYVKDSLSGKRSDEEHINFRNAFRGDSDGMVFFFTEAYQRSMSSDIAPADEVFLTWILTTILLKNGDTRFYDSLSQETPEVQSAVFSFLTSPFIPKDYHKTRGLMEAAPKIDFPLERAYQKLG
jgi:hypothetical protein